MSDDEDEISLSMWNETADCWSTPDGGLIVGMEPLEVDGMMQIAITTDKGGVFIIDADLLTKDL